MSSRDDESASGRLKLNGKSYQAQRDAEQYNVDEDNENDQFETENVYIGPKATSSGTGLKARKESIGPLATSSGPRRMSTTARRDSVNPNTPQFLTVSSTFTTRSRSRSPSPLDSLRLRGARHSIDVRTLPSYLARKRQSISFGTKNILGNLVEGELAHSFLIDSNLGPDRMATSPFEPRSPLDKEPIFEEPEAPLLSLQERVAWLVDSSPEFGTVKWIGRMPQVSSTWTVGVEFDNAIGNSDGIYRSRRYFQAKENYAKFLPLASLTKVDNYIGRPRSGTLLSRMSVQLKPGQLISVQRTPSINHLVHCALNAPHHVDHDVHGTNMDHCLCNNCNHPCAHLCKTAKPKGKKDDVAHMCHFSHKPHNKLCCGGEDLLFEEVINGSKAPLTNGNLSGSVKPIDDNLNPGHRQQQWRKVSRDHKGSEARSRKLSSNTYSAQSRRTSSAPNGSARAVGQQRRPREDREEKEEKREERSVSPKPAFRKRSGSDLSISSLPSTSSPVEVYIARGALTDESDMEGDDHHHHHSHQAHRGPDHHDSNPHHRGHRRYSDEMADSTIGVSGGLRSLVQCLVPGMSSRKKYAHHNKVSCSSGRRKKHFRPYTNSSCSSRSGTPHSREYRRRGLSVTPEPSLNYRRELNNSPCEEISELKAGAHLELLPDGSTEQFPDSPIHEPVELNDNHHPGNHSLQQGAFVRAPKETSPPLPKSPPVGHLDQVNTSANSNNNRDSATQTSIASRDSYSPAQESASGHSVTTKAEIETRVHRRTVPTCRPC
ncbi:hypothetical protein HDE_11907 [Halotydeus destructor]|nr:hypothetical protein HDE_11907 [Halotydeus destructor]